MKINVSFTLPAKDFKTSEWSTLPVTINIKPDEVINDHIEYKVAIPDYMFDALADTEPKFRTDYDVNHKDYSGCFPRNSITHKFQKTQTAILIPLLQDYINGLTTYLLDKHSIETATLKKKIFIRFRHGQTHVTNGLNGAYWGEQISQNFSYFIGYETMTDKFSSLNIMEGRKVTKRYISKTFYAGSFNKQLGGVKSSFEEQEKVFLPLPAHNQSIESFEKDYSIIDWSEEREAFCKKIHQTFINVNTDLSSFLSGLDTDKFDHLLANGNTLKFLK